MKSFFPTLESLDVICCKLRCLCAYHADLHIPADPKEVLPSRLPRSLMIHPTFANLTFKGSGYVGSYLGLGLMPSSCKNGLTGNIVDCVRASPDKGLVA